MVKANAIQVGIDPALACALVEQESAWNQWAIRYEPAFYARYVLPQRLSDPTEAQARAFSWGLFQTMGQVVREIGFKGSLPSLCDPVVATQWGLAVLQAKLKMAGGNVPRALLFWNGGGNSSYPAEVLARVPKYQA